MADLTPEARARPGRLTLTLDVEVAPAVHVFDAVVDGIRLARLLNVWVRLDLNGDKLYCPPDGDPAEIVAEWQAEVRRG